MFQHYCTRLTFVLLFGWAGWSAALSLRRRRESIFSWFLAACSHFYLSYSVMPLSSLHLPLALDIFSPKKVQRNYQSFPCIRNNTNRREQNFQVINEAITYCINNTYFLGSTIIPSMSVLIVGTTSLITSTVTLAFRSGSGRTSPLPLTRCSLSKLSIS